MEDSEGFGEITAPLEALDLDEDKEKMDKDGYEDDDEDEYDEDVEEEEDDRITKELENELLYM